MEKTGETKKLLLGATVGVTLRLLMISALLLLLMALNYLSALTRP